VEKEAQNGLSKNFLILVGSAWDSAQSYVREVQIPLLEMTSLWIEAEMEGNKAYQAAAARLPHVACLDEDQLKSNIEDWQNDIRAEEKDKYPNHRRINRLRGYIRDANAKLDAMRTFVSATRGIYDKARGINRVLNKVHYNPESMTLELTTVDPVWILELEWVWEMERARTADFTEKEIKALCERKITVNAAIAAWEEIGEQGIGRAYIAN